MIDIETNTPETAAPTKGNIASPEINRLRQITDHLSDAWANVAAVIDAQATIWSMKFLRVLILMTLAVPLSLCGMALAIYGFTLLDRSADIAMSAPGMAPWLSALVRGGLYFGVPLIGLIVLFFTAVGGPEEPLTEKRHA